MIAFETLIANYLKYKKETPHSDEFYKYEAVQHFQDNWDVDASDFSGMLDRSLKKQINLLYQYSYSTIKKVATSFPEETREQFRNLYNESKDLTTRIQTFDLSIDSLMKKIDKSKNGFQDERAISVYLTFRYPERYYFFKDSYYSKFVDLFKKKKAVKGLKYAQFVWLCDEFKEKYVKNNDELWEVTNASLPPTAWPDISKNILTQDILFCGLDQKALSTYWLFQCNPEKYDIVNEWKNINQETWRVTAHKNEINAGDKVIIWVVGKVSGCYGLCTITSDVLSNKEGNWVEMNIDYNLTEHPVLKTTLDNTEAFSNKKNTQGSNFKATKEQYTTIVKLSSIDEDGQKLVRYMLKIGKKSVVFHFQMTDLFVNRFNVKEDDHRLVFSTPDTREGLTFTVNQRYVYKTTKDSFRLNLPASEFDRIKQHPNYINHEFFRDHSGNDSNEVYFYLRQDQSFIEANKDLWLKVCKANLDNGLGSGFIKFDNPAYRKAVFDKKYREKLFSFLSETTTKPDKSETMKTNIDFSKNLILYGPPGTGKTFNTINKAMQIAAPNLYQLYKNDANREKLVSEYNRLRKNRQIEFITFHQSYGYEEFVEGIRPIPAGEAGNEEGEEMIYKVCDGIFKRICSDAEMSNNIVENETSPISSDVRVYKVSLKGERNKATKQECFNKNEIRIGWEHTGSLNILFENPENNEYFQKLGKNDKNSLSYFYNMEEGDIVLICKDSKTIDAIGIITGEYTFDESLSEYNHVRKVRWLLKDKEINIYELNGNTNLTLPTVYQLSRITPAMVSKLIQENTPEQSIVHKRDQKNFVLIIDEINRGNISKIFGELITLIEPDKRQDGANKLEVTLPYSKLKFSIPSNLYIIGTMNTADRSIALIDTALRRRFDFLEMMPDYDLVTEKTTHLPMEIDYARLLEAMNRRIEFLLDRDHVIGHSYFIGLNDYKAFVEKFHLKIIPLLQEYFYNDWQKIRLVLGDNREWGKPEELKIIVENKNINSSLLFGSNEFDDDYEDQCHINPKLIEKNYIEIDPSVFSFIYLPKGERPKI